MRIEIIVTSSSQKRDVNTRSSETTEVSDKEKDEKEAHAMPPPLRSSILTGVGLAIQGVSLGSCQSFPKPAAGSGT